MNIVNRQKTQHGLQALAWMLQSFAWLVVAASVCLAPCRSQDVSPEAQRTAEDHFETHVRPVLAKHCIECHGGENYEAGLRLDNHDAVMKGGDSGPLLVAGNPDESRLIRVIRYDGLTQMPPDGKMSDDEIALLENWIRDGAIWPEDRQDTSPATSTASPAPRTAAEWSQIHWAFQPVVEPQLPEVNDQAWLKSPLDAFVLHKLEAKGLSPSEVATRRELLRRLSFDLIGLPPTQQEISDFENDPSPDAWDRQIERLLGSPQYGERWARHWLDIARYADTKGYVGVGEGDIERREYPFAFAYRDWVVTALNDDLPYDQFIRLQIAADKMEVADPKSLAALGFFRVGRVFLGNRNDQIDDKIDVMSRGLLGLTVACARCHDHKFDPIPTADYYSLFGVFSSTQEPDDAENKRMLLADADNPHNSRIFKRGNPGTQGDEVPRRFLEVLSQPDRQPFTEGSGRLELAQSIASSQNPLTARVMVNRVWAHHFGSPLVSTPSDFGVRTPEPVHHQLLDHLAHQFMQSGWSLKELHRVICRSNTYQQSSRQRESCFLVDSENSLYWRYSRRRLDLEQFRDSMLVVSGDLSIEMGGPPVELTTAPYSSRRTVYGRIDRQNLPGMFRTFDFANPDSHSPGRFLTSVPQQGLFVFNHPFVIERAQQLEKDLSAIPAENETARIEQLFAKILARNPQPHEIDMARKYVASARENSAASDTLNAWAQLAQALIMTNEFMYID